MPTHFSAAPCSQVCPQDEMKHFTEELLSLQDALMDQLSALDSEQTAEFIDDDDDELTSTKSEDTRSFCYPKTASVEVTSLYPGASLHA